MRRFKAILTGMLMPLLAACGTSLTGGYESPDYTVVRQDGDFEIRQYAEQLVAEVTVSGTREDAVSAGFRQLADYIFGGNRPQKNIAMTTPVTQQAGEAIAMTTPVTQQSGGLDSWQVRFMMPKQYTLATLPQPENPAIKLMMLPAYSAVTVRFSGWASDSSLRTEEGRLREYVTAKGLKTTGAPAYAYYDPPWTLPFLRRNEIALRIAEMKP